MQKAVDDDRNEIPVESVRRWSRDVVFDVSTSEIVDMLVRHYSMHGDSVHVHNWSEFNAAELGRKTHHHPLQPSSESVSFWDGPFFRRYVTQSNKKKSELVNLGDPSFQVLLGDSAEVLRSLPDDVFDGAVTSPPYYNAREYAKWTNMYCHLHDMLDITREVFRTLKPGSLYLYNVFDYFDNENTIVFSAMGQRRMILSAYTVDFFRRVGFELAGNVVWDKGEIEGKRGFNAGNFSPYYQAPFNCWEHVLVFRKPSTKATAPLELASRVIRQQPVLKMVKGENVHGHTAPFPNAIPELLISRLPKGSVVLDPFGGSLTTGRVAEKYGLKSVCIERSKEYCLLGLKMRESSPPEDKNRQAQLAMF
jgi:DNA modification methylase